MRSTVLITAMLLALAGCSAIGPDYVRPPVKDLPQSWKTESGWQLASPSDIQPKTEWWRVFGDDTLNELQSKALAENPGLKAALARLDQAQAQIRIHGAANLPTAALTAGVSDSRISANRPKAAYGTVNQSTVQNDIKPEIIVSYEIDWLGRVRRDIESIKASAEQAVADQENVRLILTAQLANAYFQLRQQDEETRTLLATTHEQEKILQLTRIRHQYGVASASDVSIQSGLLESNKAQLEILNNQRRQNEDLIATLAGIPAISFKLAPGSLPVNVPIIPSVVPSQLLERRPDIASAERAMAAANAQIGVAKAAYFPLINLVPLYSGYESTGLSNLFSAQSLIWSIGVQSSQTLFNNGKTSAGVDFAQANYTATVANYRQTVLQAVQEAQDALSNTQGLANANQQQSEAVKEQNRTLDIALERYREGLDNSLTLATVQQNQLIAQRTLSQIRGSQFVTTVSLLRALGGGWSYQ